MTIFDIEPKKTSIKNISGYVSVSDIINPVNETD